MSVIQSIKQSLLAVGLAAPRSTVEYTRTPNFKAFLTANSKFKDLIFNVLALDVYFFWKLNDLEYRKKFIFRCIEIRNCFKIFLLAQSRATDCHQRSLKIEQLLLKYANFIYAAMTAYIDMAHQNNLKSRASAIHKAGYFFSLAAKTIKEARYLLPDSML
ncbi:hypothetical protein [Eubacterium sp. 1001713B170207_170306_E7]|uniref:hypothetical protein n=1 Tax=Eubacterium sp. 1001713B170207_170306_E7 TaxID=2787097 RepID=UPI001897BB3D|nr:hypothetical protein [Eubacterium sp. 1001713B170207_170306_E7]